MPLFAQKKCIKCGGTNFDKGSALRTGIAAKKCYNCLMEETINLAEEAAAKEGTLQYVENPDGSMTMKGLVGAKTKYPDSPT